ncbi:MAG: helix-turn-helix transcriptional regulator [Saprospiraceae bacterium]|mgnify:FL=1|nr:helix-turn-helix transcriptional regulator [Saprospiraceae bacterium]
MEERPSGFYGLTAREMYIMGLLQQGLSYEAIALEGRITLGTVKQHVHHILKKTSSPNKTVAINLWREWMKDQDAFYKKNPHP